jgi:3-oxoacyl-[acyl-carrier protein] reductase
MCCAIANRLGSTLDQFLDAFSDVTLLQRSPTLTEVANVAVFMASDQARAMTGTVANVTCSSIVD